MKKRVNHCQCVEGSEEDEEGSDWPVVPGKGRGRVEALDTRILEGRTRVIRWGRETGRARLWTLQGEGP